jgi:hypothetical protein
VLANNGLFERRSTIERETSDHSENASGPAALRGGEDAPLSLRPPRHPPERRHRNLMQPLIWRLDFRLDDRSDPSAEARGLVRLWDFKNN